MRSLQWYGLLAALCLIAFLPDGVLAQQSNNCPSFEHHYVMHYDDESGLRSNDISGFFEDVNGYLWFTTQFGLLRFDGRNFRHYYTGNLPTLTSNRLYSLNSDNPARAFFADESSGVHLIDSNGNIQPVPGARARYNFLVSTHGYILDLRKYYKNAADSARLVEEARASKYYLATHDFYPDSYGHTWVMSGHDISYFKDGYFYPVDYYDQEDRAHFYIGNTLFVMDSIGRVTTYQEGKKLKLRFSFQQVIQEKEIPDLRRFSFCSNKMGTFLQYQDKLYALSFDGQMVKAHLLLTNLQLPSARLVAYSARYRLYILLTNTNGFYLIREQPFSTRSFKDGLENSFAATVEIRPGLVLTSNGVLFTKDTARRIYDYNLQVFNTMLKDDKQQIWFQGGDTLFCMDNRLQERKRWVITTDTYLKVLQQDNDGTIWYCTNNGLARLNNGQLQLLYSGYKEFDRAQCMYFLNDSIIWIGTTKGLYAFNKKSHTITPVEGMANYYVRHIYRARDSTLWIGTYGQGFFTYRNGRFIALPQDRNHYLATAHCFMEDDNGFFWIPTNKGLFQVPKQELEAWIAGRGQQVYYYYYDKKDGFASNEFNGGSTPVGIRLQDGTFSLPSMKGLVWFNPLQVKPQLPVQDIRIDKILVDTHEVAFSNELAFEPGSRTLSFQVSAAFFGNPENFFPEYRIATVDKFWAPVPANNTIVFNYLPPGKYTLEVRLRRGFGAADYTTRSQSFSIAPYFYQRLWFRLLAGLLGLSLSMAIMYRYSQRKERKTRKKAKEALEKAVLLEQLVTDRTRELQETVADLRVSEENLHQSNLLKDKLTSVILHDIRSPLRFINMLSNQLNQAQASGDTRSMAALTTELRKSSTQLDAFTREFMMWLNIQQAGFKIRKGPVHLQQLLQEMEEFYRNTLNWNNNALQVEIKKDIQVSTDRQLLKIILHNLLDNANKHTEQGTIRLRAVQEEKELVTITVADSGRGMTDSELKVLRNRLNNNLWITDGTGNLGYRIIRDFIHKLNGHIAIESVLNAGTSVTIRIPVS